MTRSVLCLCLLLLALPLVATVRAQPEEGARRLTEGAELFSLHSWPTEGSVLALGEEGAWLRFDEARGTRQPIAAPAPRAAARLTVGVENVTHRLQLDGQTLFTTSDEVLGRPTLAPDGRWLVVARSPRGNEMAAYSELWRYDLQTREWLQLTQNGVEERAPLVSPDGQRIAFVRDGELWTIPADRTTVEKLVASEPDPHPLAPRASLEPPATIRVKHDDAGNTCRDIPDGQIDIIPFEEYVKRVTPYESPPSWHIETLKAQAVAARSYGWRQLLIARDLGREWDVLDSTAYQYMCDETINPNTDIAVDATTGQAMFYLDLPIFAMFSAENSSPTKNGNYYLAGVDDPLSFGYRRYGHGFGFSQWGGKRHADAGWSYIQILRHYYSGATLEPAPSNTSSTLVDVSNRPDRDYLRGAAIWLEMNAANVAGVQWREWYSLDGGATWNMGEWQEDRDTNDGWGHLFDLRALPDIADDLYRVEYAPLFAQARVPEATLPVLYLGIDRSAPTLTGALTVGEPVDGTSVYNVSATVAASDATSGVERIGMSQEAWQQEAEQLGGVPVIADGGASGGQALRLEPGESGAQSLTFPSFSLQPGHYRVWFRVRTNAVLTGTRIATLRLNDTGSPSGDPPLQRGMRHLSAAEFPSTEWIWFYVDVDSTLAYTSSSPGVDGYDAPMITPVIQWYGTQRLDIDRMLAATRPGDLPSSFASTLVPPAALTLYASDQAGNVSFLRCAPRVAQQMRPAAPGPRLSNRLLLPLVTRAETWPPSYHCDAQP